MTMKRTKTPWMEADDFGRSLPLGIGINLLVPEIAQMEAFCRDVLGATIVYADEDFAAVTLLGSVFMLHADHSYSDNPMTGVIAGVEQRGTGIEIRIYGLDPDEAEARAREHGHHVLAGSIDKPHGLRECHIVGPSFYVFVPSLAIGG
jgi:catechol 2,3-dioxygenase-like lactoylglutathione lyase family enzyme